MTISTINSAITTGVTIGTGAYAGTGTLIITGNGTINVNGNGTFGVAAPAGQPGISISNAGLISASWGGVQLENAGDSFNNTGTIIAAFQPVDLNGGVVTNSGYINASGGAAYGVSVQKGTLINAGSISGFFGAGLTSAASTLDNRGSITGKYEGVYLHNGATLLNSGYITATGSYGTGVLLTGGLAENNGDITGDYGIIASGGYIFNTGNVTGGIAGINEVTAAVYNGAYIGGVIGIQATGGLITNAGIIYGSSYAILGSTLDILVQAGAYFQGMVHDTAGAGTLVLGGGPTGSLNLSSFAGFDTIQFATTGWVLEGGTAELATGETIQAFQPGDTIILDGFSASAASYVSGTGLVLSNANASTTLLLAMDNTQFSVSSAGGATEITALISTISGYVNAGYYGVSLGGSTYAADLTITNTGTVQVAGAIAAYGGVEANGTSAVTITNEGSILCAIGIKLGTVINTGLIKDGIRLNSGLIVDSGTILSPLGIINPNAYTAISARGSLTLVLEPGAKIQGGIQADGGTLVLAGNNPDSIYFNQSSPRYWLDGFSQISFATGEHHLRIGSPTSLDSALVLDGFGAGDTLDLADLGGTGAASYVTGSGIVFTNLSDGSQAAFELNGGASPSLLSFTTLYGGQEILVTAACFCRGTRIATPRGGKAVEQLAIGDIVTTDLGTAPIKWIGRRDYDGAFIAGSHLALPIKIRRHALGRNVPSRDVYLSPDHGVCEGGVFIPAWRLLNGVSITQRESVGRVEYFHIELEIPAVIFAENMPVESFVDADCRQRFQNAAEFARLYPNAPKIQKPCRPRIEDGFLLQRITSRINARAGLKPAADSTGPLRGNIDTTTPRLTGWAQDTSAPETPVTLEILHNGTIIGHIIANRYREDLRAAGLGSGCHAFDLPALPTPLTLRRPTDGATLAAPETRAA